MNKNDRILGTECLLIWFNKLNAFSDCWISTSSQYAHGDAVWAMLIVTYNTNHEYFFKIDHSLNNGIFVVWAVSIIHGDISHVTHEDNGQLYQGCLATHNKISNKKIVHGSDWQCFECSHIISKIENIVRPSAVISSWQQKVLLRTTPWRRHAKASRCFGENYPHK